MKRSRRDTICFIGDNTYAFKAGQSVELTLTGDGNVRVSRWYEVAGRRVLHRLKRATRWFRPRNVVDNIDTGAGLVRIRQERWSWLRWRWEVV